MDESGIIINTIIIYLFHILRSLYSRAFTQSHIHWTIFEHDSLCQRQVKTLRYWYIPSTNMISVQKKSGNFIHFYQFICLFYFFPFNSFQKSFLIIYDSFHFFIPFPFLSFHNSFSQNFSFSLCNSLEHTLSLSFFVIALLFLLFPLSPVRVLSWPTFQLSTPRLKNSSPFARLLSLFHFPFQSSLGFSVSYYFR